MELVAYVLANLMEPYGCRVFYELLAKLTVMYDASRLLSLFLEVHVKYW
jgi:hypothetical protein